MRITRHQPPPPPAELQMTFSEHEGWAVRAALMDYADAHPHAADAAKWKEWAKLLDRELRR